MLRLLPLLRDTVPVYVTTPTAPKLIALPVTVPLICRVSRGDVSAIDPWSAEPVSIHWSTNVPLKGPLYCPVQFPDRSSGGVGPAVGGGVRMGVGVAVAVAAGVGVPLVVEALHPPSAIAARAKLRARNLLRNIDLASTWVIARVCTPGSCHFPNLPGPAPGSRSSDRSNGRHVVALDPLKVAMWARRCSLVAFEHPRSRQTL
jgi:hypothetical protein